MTYLSTYVGLSVADVIATQMAPQDVGANGDEGDLEELTTATAGWNMASQTSKNYRKGISLIDFDGIEAEADHNLTDVDGSFSLDTDNNALRDTDMTTSKGTLSHDDSSVGARKPMKLNTSLLSSNVDTKPSLKRSVREKLASKTEQAFVNQPPRRIFQFQQPTSEIRRDLLEFDHDLQQARQVREAVVGQLTPSPFEISLDPVARSRERAWRLRKYLPDDIVDHDSIRSNTQSPSVYTRAHLLLSNRPDTAPKFTLYNPETPAAEADRQLRFMFRQTRENWQAASNHYLRPFADPVDGMHLTRSDQVHSPPGLMQSTLLPAASCHSWPSSKEFLSMSNFRTYNVVIQYCTNYI